ncbi:hypothetical protein GH714_017012 [Hevea brasiliensis]|uniref:Uncharacterized protein n=1 Tax=Hevea brasiliensis TaxID=3981 RepID=A0A6A6N0E7_HEVBR|nr:hypothetical protein GH714_017012 [Hevea brasiliensis]
MAERVLFYIAGEIIKKLGSRALQEIGVWWGVKDELQKLKGTVSRIRAVLLDAEKKAALNEQVKDWLGQLQEIVYDADDLIDDFATEALQRQVMTGNRMTKEVSLFFSSSNRLVYGFKMGHKIKAIRKRLLEIHADTESFNLEVHNEERGYTTKVRDQTESSVPEVVIGRDGDKKAIIEFLLASNSEENVSVLSIVGIGGLGKTTLAQFIFNDEQVSKRFEVKLWVCVSDPFDVKMIVKKILESAKGTKSEELELEALKSHLGEIINGKKYMLVLDDVWNENSERWDSLKKLLVGGSGGSKILVTTRSIKVAKVASTVEPYVLEGLSPTESWSLFLRVALKGQEPKDSSVKKTGEEIVNKCVGVPLAIKTIASILCFKNPETEWHLYCDCCWHLTHMPRGLGQLTSLRTLTRFVVAEDNSVAKNVGGLNELNSLNNLRGSLEIADLGYVKNGIINPILKDKSLLQSLSLSSDRYGDANVQSEEMAFQNLEPHPNLKELKVYSYRGARLPSWVSSLTNLVNIQLGNSRCQHLPPLDQFPSLQMLDIWALNDLEYIEIEGQATSFVPSLKVLKLWDCRKLIGWRMKRYEDDSDDSTTISSPDLLQFPCLSEFHCRGCPNLSLIPQFPSLDEDLELRKVSVQLVQQILTTSTSSSSSSIVPPFSKLKKLIIWDIKDLEFLPPDGLHNLTSLQQLEIMMCPRLTSLPQEMRSLTSLRELTISVCPLLSKRCAGKKGEDWPFISHIPNVKVDGKRIQWEGCYLLEDEEKSSTTSNLCGSVLVATLVSAIRIGRRFRG